MCDTSIIYYLNYSVAAVEMWIFAVYLPLMIGHIVPEDDKMWECYMLLLDILKLCTSRVQSPDLVAYLEVLIGDHHHSFTHCYPSLIYSLLPLLVFTYPPRF